MNKKSNNDPAEILDTQFEKKFIRLFNQGFEEVVIPQLEEIGKDIEGVKKGLNQVENRLDSIETRLGSLDRKVDRVVANQLDDKYILKTCEKRITKLESQKIAA